METDNKDMLVHILQTHFATPVKSTTFHTKSCLETDFSRIEIHEVIMNITRVFTALLFALQRGTDILSPGPAASIATAAGFSLNVLFCPSSSRSSTTRVNFSPKRLAQSRALVRHLAPIVQLVLETCGSQDRDHRRYLETSWLRAPEPQAVLRRFPPLQALHPPCSPGSTAPGAEAMAGPLLSSSWPEPSWSPASGSSP